MSERSHYIALVGKVVRVLETLRDAPDGLHLQAIAERTGYVKSSLHRILLSLKRHDYVQQGEPGGPYRLGAKCVALGREANQRVSLAEVGKRHLRELQTSFDETAYLAVLRGDRGIFVDVQESTRDLRLVGPLGADVHFHATAAGKAMAAFLPPERRAALLERQPLVKLTPRTLTSSAAVDAEWARVRRTGVATNQDETIVGAVFHAAPIFDAEGQVCGAISIGVPRVRYNAALGKSIAAALKASCRELSNSLASSNYVHRAESEGQ